MKDLLLAWVITMLAVDCCHAADPFLLVGEEPTEAVFESARANGTLHFLTAGQQQIVSPKQIIRWSTPRTNLRHAELLLTDGSRIVLAAAWAGQPSWQLADQDISATTKLFGTISLPRNQLQAIVLRRSSNLKRRTSFWDRLLLDGEHGDQLHLLNGDRLEGTFVRVTRRDDGQRLLHFRLPTGDSLMEISAERVAAITFRHDTRSNTAAAKWQVGTRDGSLLMTDSWIADDSQLRIRSPAGTTFVGSDARDVVYLRSHALPCVFLSDLEASDFRHVAYLKIPWKYHRDRNVLRGPLRAQGRHYTKGIGMHSASRLTYRLDTPKLADRFQRFAAQVSIDDDAEQRGSVIFRVYLFKNGDWQEAYVSPVVRGGDLPRTVSVTLGQAQQIALVTDFADRGDELDYANWLDARFE